MGALSAQLLCLRSCSTAASRRSLLLALPGAPYCSWRTERSLPPPPPSPFPLSASRTPGCGFCLFLSSLPFYLTFSIISLSLYIFPFLSHLYSSLSSVFPLSISLSLSPRLLLAAFPLSISPSLSSLSPSLWLIDFISVHLSPCNSF